MRKNGCQKLPTSAVWFVDAWVMTEHQPNYTIFVPDRDGVDQTISTLFQLALNTTEGKQEYMDSAQKDLFATTDLPNKTY